MNVLSNSHSIFFVSLLCEFMWFTLSSQTQSIIRAHDKNCYKMVNVYAIYSHKYLYLCMPFFDDIEYKLWFEVSIWMVFFFFFFFSSQLVFLILYFWANFSFPICFDCIVVAVNIFNIKIVHRTFNISRMKSFFCLFFAGQTLTIQLILLLDCINYCATKNARHF